ncbi:MAG: ATP-dependent Clp protease ATP-binding subunit [Candidatus Magasanikbacteria bacterium]|nr:ATP-dependent Clp protease ATP-binding subunit [Candidatus Magasanikbacteria bacterium]
MLFEKAPTISILSCQACKSTGYIGIRPCYQCRAMSMGTMYGDYFLYYGEPLSQFHIDLRRARRWLNNFEIIGAIVFLFGFAGLFVADIMRLRLVDAIWTSDFWIKNISVTQPLWISLIFLGFFIYRIIAAEVTADRIKNTTKSDGETSLFSSNIDYLTWDGIKKIPRRKRVDVSRFYTHQTRIAVAESFSVAKAAGSETVLPEHIVYALLTIVPEIRGIFIRLGIGNDHLKALISKIFVSGHVARTPVISTSAEQALFLAYDVAIRAGQDEVDVTDLLLACVGLSEPLQEVLYDLNVDARKLANVVEWVRIRARLKRAYNRLRRAAAHRSKHGIDRAMTAVATPFLNAYSQDITLAAKFGYLEPCVAREKEIDEIFRIIEGGRQNVLLVGQPGVGKMSIIEGIAERMVEERVPARLQDKRLVQLSTTALLAGTTTSGAEERLLHMMAEIRKAGNVILFINNIHDLVSIAGGGGKEGLDVASALAEYTSGGSVVFFATTTPEDYNKYILNSELGSVLIRVDVNEMNDDQTIQVLESRIGTIEYKQQVFFSYDSLASAADLAHRYLHDRYLPESAIEIITEAASVARSKRGANQLVLPNDVASIVSGKTGIPTSSISEEESDKLLRLESVMHERVVGQDEAVSLVANALRRARAEIRSTSRPIANFLFLGPTGVGKTELAKTIAEVYFGGENRMVRLDMSEYQDKASVYRLIGQPGRQGTGILTEAVRQRPFSLVLLDELEKADPDVLNLFLQVFDDGRLTDSVGRVIDFTNTIIIATSNAGTQFIQASLASGMPLESVHDQLLKGELSKYYRPEFLNRFDGVVLFRPLEKDQIKHIAKLMLNVVAKDLEKRGVELRVEDSALEALAVIGFDPVFGARPMRRAIQDRVENALAQFILEGKLGRRDIVVLDGEGLRVEKAK